MKEDKGLKVLKKAHEQIKNMSSKELNDLYDRTMAANREQSNFILDDICCVKCGDLMEECLCEICYICKEIHALDNLYNNGIIVCGKCLDKQIEFSRNN